MLALFDEGRIKHMEDAQKSGGKLAGIYHLDNMLAGLSMADCPRERNLTIKVLVEAYLTYLKTIKEQRQALLTGKALKGVNYSINHEKQLYLFLEDDEVHLDNNATEGALRSFCLYKHTWKLIDTIEGAKSSAIIYSITETVKANHLNPHQYLGYLLTEQDTDSAFLSDLFPWTQILLAICKIDTKS